MHQAATGVAANHLHQCLLRSRVNPNGVGINGHCGQAMFPMLQASRTEEPTTQLKVCITGNGAARAYRTVSRVFLTNDQEAQLTTKFPGVKVARVLKEWRSQHFDLVLEGGAIFAKANTAVKQGDLKCDTRASPPRRLEKALEPMLELDHR